MQLRFKMKWVPALAVAGLLIMASVLTEADAAPAKKRGWLGVTVQELTPSLRDALNLGNRAGLLISQVIEDSPADEAGLREEDVLLEYNGQKVERVKTLTSLVRNTEPGSKVEIRIFRDGKEKTLTVEIGRRKFSDYRVFSFSPESNVLFFGGRSRMGVQIHDLNRDLAPYFEVERGVLILDVSEDSPAEEAGLKAGDVIVKIDEETVRDVEDLQEILSDYEDGDVVQVEFVRKGKTNKVEVELEDDDGSWSYRLQRWPRTWLRRLLPGREDIEIIFPEANARLELLREQLETLRHEGIRDGGRRRIIIRGPGIHRNAI